MALSFDQYRYFSAAWLRNQSLRPAADRSEDESVEGEPPASAGRAASITRLVPRPRDPETNETE